MKKAIIIILLGLGGFTANAQVKPDPDTTAKHFLTEASIGNLQEVTAGQLAVQKSKRADVRGYGQMMVKDHGQAQQQLLQVAKTRKYDLPPAATGGIQPDLNLKNAGDNFDKMYVHAMVTSHRNTVEKFETYAVTGKDPAVRAFAQQKLPALKAHLAEITAIEKQLDSPVK
jgi:putative membrane protein